MNKKKPFAPRRREPTELHFFSSLSLDEAMRCIRELASEYDVEIAPLDEDAYGFEIYYHFVGKYALNTGFVTGVVRRWEGTYTRVDCDGEIRRTSLVSKRNPPRSGEAYLLMTIFILLGMLMLLPLFQGYTFVMMVLVAIFRLFMYWSKAHLFKISQLPDLMYMRQQDEILDNIKSTFELTGIIAYSPEELSAKITASPTTDEAYTDDSTLNASHTAENTSYE